MARQATGKVGIHTLRGRLRLFWSFAGERYFLHLGLTDNRVNRLTAESKAKQIEIDIATGVFDTTLKKYKGEHQSLDRIKVTDLFARFIEWKSARIHKHTLEKYHSCSSHLKTYFGDRMAASITEKDVERFRREHLGDRDPVTVKGYVKLCKACWEWAIDQDILSDENPWAEIVIKIPTRQRPQPLQKEEVQRVLEAFRAHKTYCYYADFVEFLLSTGVRTGEAIGLRWCHVSEDCKRVWIGETISRGARKETKTNRDRTLVLTPRLQEMLQHRKAVSKNELVFPAPKGGAIHDQSFRRRQWKQILELANVPYRKFYITRSTMISHALAQGINPVEIAELTGHDVEVLFKNYAGVIQSKPKLPDLWD